MLRSVFTPSMVNAEFVDVARQLEELLSELNQVGNPALRRSMLAAMRLLIAEADRVSLPKAAAKEGQL